MDKNREKNKTLKNNNEQRERAVVLLSSGLDSSVNLWAANKKYEVILALTIDYGQRAASKEIQSSQALCAQLKIPFKGLSLLWMKNFGGSALLDETLEVPQGPSVDINSLERSHETAQKVWVPNRNGIFLQIAAGFAESLRAKYVIVGFNAEEAATFPDNTKDFMEATDRSLFYSTQNHVQVKCFTADMTKTEIVQYGQNLGVPWENLWPCYFSYEKWCGTCESCQRFRRALAALSVNLDKNFLS